MKGYIAITTTIILSLIMLALAVAIGNTTLLTRTGMDIFVDKQTSYFVARSCLEYARFQLANNPGYAGNETRIIETYDCSLLAIEDVGENKIIKATSTVNNANTNLRLTINELDLSTVSLEELPEF